MQENQKVFTNWSYLIEKAKKAVTKKFLPYLLVSIGLLWFSIGAISSVEEEELSAFEGLTLLAALLFGFIGSIVFGFYGLILNRKLNKFKLSLQHYKLGNYLDAYKNAIPLANSLRLKDLNDYINFLEQRLNIKSEDKKTENLSTPKSVLKSVSKDTASKIQEIDAQMEIIHYRIAKYTGIRHILQEKSNKLKSEYQKLTDEQIQNEYKKLLDNYRNMLEFVEFKLETYKDLKSKLQALKERLIYLERIKAEKEQLKKYETALLKEGYRSEHQDQDIIDFYQVQSYYTKYIHDFLNSDEEAQTQDEFNKLKQKLYQQLKNLDTDVDKI